MDSAMYAHRQSESEVEGVSLTEMTPLRIVEVDGTSVQLVSYQSQWILIETLLCGVSMVGAGVHFNMTFLMGHQYSRYFNFLTFDVKFLWIPRHRITVVVNIVVIVGTWWRCSAACSLWLFAIQTGRAVFFFGYSGQFCVSSLFIVIIVPCTWSL